MNNLSNIFERGTPRSGSLQGPTQTSAFERGVSKAATPENAALLLSGGKTENLLFAGGSKIAEGITGLSTAKRFKFKAKLAEAQGRANATDALERLNDVQAANIVASFASGVRLQGSTAVVQQVVSSQADFSAAISKANAALVAGGLRREARQARRQGLLGTILGAGLLVAGGSLFGGAGASSKAISEAEFLI